MTDIIFSFDTEDFTSDVSANAIKREADILSSEGVKGCFCLVGLLAERLLNQGRQDVLEALSHHEIQLHTYGHTLHPMLNEYTDIADFDAARNEVIRQETAALAAIKKATGTERVFAAVPPGNQKSYAAMYAYADMGIPIFADTLCDPVDGSGAFYCNIYNIDYTFCMESVFFKGGEKEIKAELDKLASRKRAVIYTHPHISLFKEHWDIINYDKKNIYPFGKWKEAPRRSEEESERFYEKLVLLLRLVKSDPRFRIITYGELAKELAARPERTVSVSDIPRLREWLSHGLRPTEGEGSLSVADIFLACRDLLCGKQTHICGKTKGFLEAPRGITDPVTVTADEIRQSAVSIPEDGFLPVQIWVNGKALGTADWLRAAMAVLCGEDTVTVTPGEQLVSLNILPRVRDCSFAGTWRHSDDFKDKYLSDRLRLQCWTLRF
ncbi:MAG: hypothetical protein ACI4IX_07045 [Acutalibacteraceae bacterium]